MDITDVILNSTQYTDTAEQLKYIIKNCNCSAEEFQIRLFEKLVKTIQRPCPVLIELGSGGTDASFYSIIFEKVFDLNCTIINTEPRKYLLDNIKPHFKDIHLKNAKLEWGYNGRPQESFKDVPFLTIENLIKKYNIDFIDVLHMDIQGAEIDVCEEIFKKGYDCKIKYLFINTHDKAYSYCSQYFDDRSKYFLHFSDEKSGGYGDGLIVAERIL